MLYQAAPPADVLQQDLWRVPDRGLQCVERQDRGGHLASLLPLWKNEAFS